MGIRTREYGNPTGNIGPNTITVIIWALSLKWQRIGCP